MRSDRRNFLRFLAASPLAGQLYAQQAGNPKLEDIISVLDLEELAHKALPAAHWGYMASGVDDDLTLRQNREGYRHIQLRPRRLVDVSTIDTKVEVFGSMWESPIFLCPVGGTKAFYRDGEVAVARASKAKNILQIMSTQSSFSVEDVTKARGAAPWYQLYMPPDWTSTEKMVKRAEAAGCPALAWTVDLLGGRNLETAERQRRLDERDCTLCHTGAKGGTRPRPMFDGVAGGTPANAEWSWVTRLKKMTTMKILIKGIETGEDARLALEHGADGVLVSNHGGRATETYRGTIEALPEVVDAVGTRIPVFVDGGIRRGTDIIKALALGARAVGVGRPYLWGLTAYGEEGVARVVDILRAELALAMRECGAPNLARVNRSLVQVDGRRM